MSYTITKAKEDLQGVLKGTSVNKITNINRLFNRAARQLLEDVDPQETKRKAQIANAIYDQVYDYSAPSDLKGNKIIDLRPQVNRSQSDSFSQAYSRDFDLNKLVEDNLLQVTFNQGVKTIRIKKSLTGAIAVNEVNGISTNGTWVGSNDATNLTTDSLNYVSGSGSVRFDLSGATTTGTLTNSTFTAIDLSDHEDESSLFLWVFLPDSSVVTSFSLRWGSSAADYWSDSATTQHIGAFVNGWNLLRFDWNGATETGTPSASAVDYLQLSITYNGDPETDIRIDNVVSNLGQIFDAEYYSKYLFTSGSSGAWIEEVASDSDYLNLDTDSYNLFLFKAAELAAQQSEMTKDDTMYFSNQYMRAVGRYKGMYKSEVMKPRAFYYKMR